MSRRADLPLTLKSAVQMLEWGTFPENAPCSHEQIAAWCHRFWHQYIEGDVPPEIGKILPILTDVETQWHHYLVNSFTLEQLRARSAVKDASMPVEWFESWLRQAKAVLSAS
jgi:hypothetical protein